MSTPDQRQAEWDLHVTTALEVARTGEEVTGIAAMAAAGRRAWDQHKAGNDGTGVTA